MYALVTGASSGIGQQYATELAKQKYDLVLVSNQEKEIQEVANELSQNYGIKTIALYRDLAKDEAAQELYTYCKENNLQIDILINNAGIFFFNEFFRFEDCLDASLLCLLHGTFDAARFHLVVSGDEDFMNLHFFALVNVYDHINIARVFIVILCHKRYFCVLIAFTDVMFLDGCFGSNNQVRC